MIYCCICKKDLSSRGSDKQESYFPCLVCSVKLDMLDKINDDEASYLDFPSERRRKIR